jgi:hypothetical protein
MFQFHILNYMAVNLSIKEVLDGSLAGWWPFTAERFWALWANIYECVCCYDPCHGNGYRVLGLMTYLCTFAASDFLHHSCVTINQMVFIGSKCF